VRLDPGGNLLSWSDAEAPYAEVATLAFNALETKFLPQGSGLETWLGYSRFDPETFDGVAWPHNPAGLYAMLTDSAVLFYAWSGQSTAIDIARKALDYQLAHGTTPADWDWAAVPYASAGAGDADYAGADDAWCDYCGRGDGIGVIEADKVGELGVAYLQMFELTSSRTYLDAAVACADALAKHVRSGDQEHSPWPFRVYAQSNIVREEYSSNVVGALVLFEALERLHLGGVVGYERARSLAVAWLLSVPLKNDAWSGYFEDIEIHHDPTANPNQYSALATARWLMAHPTVDRAWREHVLHLLAWTAQTFGGDTDTERGEQWGATVLSEQAADMAKMASHTARFGATTALWSEATGDASARARAARSLNWATYACRQDGVVAVSEKADEGFWFSDGYGDYVRHFLVAMAAVPEWAPAHESHILRSTSIVTHVAYAKDGVSWTTFDADATDTLKLVSRPARIELGGQVLAERATLSAQGYTMTAMADGATIVRVRHTVPGEVRLSLTTPGEDARALTPVTPSALPSGLARAALGLAVALGAAAFASASERRRRRARHGSRGFFS